MMILLLLSSIPSQTGTIAEEGAILDAAVSTSALAAMDDTCADCTLVHQCISDISPLRVSATLYRRSDDRFVQVRAIRPWRTSSWLVDDPCVVTIRTDFDCAHALDAVESYLVKSGSKLIK